MISAPLIEYLKKGMFTFLGTVLAVYLFVIMLTYTGNDPSWSHISSDMTTINNMGGAMGAWLSDLLYSFFGFGAWWLLLFLIYECTLIWWQHRTTFWVLRLVAYVFLLLSSSALFAQLVALIQQVTNPAASGLEGIAGGIVGLELQVRLAQLLTQWGSALFLLVFVVITATFAFNIHWQALYRKLTELSWLGSGVKAKAAAKSDKLEDTAGTEVDEVPEFGEQPIRKSSKKSKPDYGQLPLELQPVQHAGEDSTTRVEGGSNSERFGNVLTEFLVKSGIGASVRETLATESAGSSSSYSSNNQEAIHRAINKNQTPIPAVKEGGNITITPSTRKIEPSFAWNDAGTVNNLLAAESAESAESTHAKNTQLAAELEASSPAVPYTTPSNYDRETHASDRVTSAVAERDAKTNDAEFKATESDLATLKTTEPNASEASVAKLEDESSIDEPSIDELASTWLAEHESEQLEPEVQPQASQAEPTEQVIPPSAQPLSNPIVSEENLESQSTAADSVDMTPTNTPPANPKAAPTVKTPVASDAEIEVPAKSTMSFAIPEGDSSNHITDMMPDSDSSAPVMPDIHDDAAFAKRSRAMQTSEYRAQLTPIPELTLLDKPDPDREPSYTTTELEQLSELLEIKLQEFNVKAEVVNAIPGPVVTRFEVDLAAGVKASKVTGISRDLARSLSMASLRVVEVIPGKPYIGIEVPNKQREMVRLVELLNTDKYRDPKVQISMAMGKDIGGKPIITDLARAPHMLVAGTTGSGKSVLVNSMLLSILLKYTPNELRLILIDPKQLELANYNDIPHLLTPVVTDMTEAASSLSWCVAEMERRYQLMSLLKVRKLSDFNKKVLAAEKAGKPLLDPLWRPNDNVSIDQAPKLKTLPMIVIVADEFADMIMQVGKQAEELITRLAQKSRAAGIHLMLATQRPSVDVITGLIKANIPVRAALRVNSKVDSRTILDSGGAEDMLGNGDMLFLGPGQIEPDRVHGAYVSDEEVNRVCDAWRERGAPDYIDNMASNFELSSPGGGSTGSPSGEDDDLYNDAVAFVMETRKVSASSIQRKFSIGYNRAARIVDSMEEAGLVSAMGKSGKRELLM